MADKKAIFTQAIWHITQELQEAVSLDNALAASLEIIIDTLGSEAGTIWLLDTESNRLYPLFNRGPADISGITIENGQGIAGHVVKSGESVIIEDAAADRERFENNSRLINAVVVLLLVLAGVMAYFIEMNLSVTYIEKKTRELTIMRINGFTVRECINYVAWDLVVTTLLGTLQGLVAGHFLGQWMLTRMEGPYMQGVHDLYPLAILFPALITIGFSAVVSGAALRRVRNLKLSDII